MASSKRLCRREIEVILESDSEAFSEEERHHTSIKDQIHWLFSCCFLRKLSDCWWWRQTDSIISTWTPLTKAHHLSLTYLRQKCVCSLE
jgi:hypothetical protein